mmetsp:Transcript_80888/g.172970  ORF Transcript_80888/g.172970 Transcript_80888/m.172970 type:complete len:213 (-) Transcript_80888:114-752(-)
MFSTFRASAIDSNQRPLFPVFGVSLAATRAVFLVFTVLTRWGGGTRALACLRRNLTFSMSCSLVPSQGNPLFRTSDLNSSIVPTKSRRASDVARRLTRSTFRPDSLSPRARKCSFRSATRMCSQSSAMKDAEEATRRRLTNSCLLPPVARSCSLHLAFKSFWSNLSNELFSTPRRYCLTRSSSSAFVPSVGAPRRLNSALSLALVAESSISG